MNDTETFGARVRRLRKGLNMSQAQLATESHMSAGTIGDIEQGTNNAPSKIDLLATALKTTTEYLRYGKSRKADSRLPTDTLSARESTLIEKFRNISEKNRKRLEIFAEGIPPAESRKKGGASRKETAAISPSKKKAV